MFVLNWGLQGNWVSSLQLVGAVLSLVVVDVIVLMKWSQSFLLSLCSVLAIASIYTLKGFFMLFISFSSFFFTCGTLGMVGVVAFIR